MAPFRRKPNAPRGPLHCKCPSNFPLLTKDNFEVPNRMLAVFKRDHIKRVKAKITRKTRNVKALRWTRKAPYTLSVKLSDFTVWRHTWRENWVNCVVLTDNSAGLRPVFPFVFHTQNCAVHSGNPTVSSVYLPTPRWHHLKAHPFLAIHSAEEHRMIYSFSIPLLTPHFTLSFLLFGKHCGRCG